MQPTSRYLNVGCGGAYRCGFLNVDLYDRTVADVCADAALLPFDDQRFERAELTHVIEHLGYVKALHAIAEAYRVLEPGGVLVVETPDPERTFERFVSDRTREVRAQLLSWIFGYEAPGYVHRLLFPAELLEDMLIRAGFRDVRSEEPRTHRYAPGLRMVARRGDRPVHDVLARLRRWILESGQVDLSHQLQALEFEQSFVGRVLGLGGAGDSPLDPVAAAIDNILMSAPAAKTWLELCNRHAALALPDRERLLSVANAAVAERLPDRLDALFERLCDEGTTADDGFANLCDEGRDALRRALRSPPGQARGVLAEGLPDPVTTATGAEARPPLTRVAFESRVAALHNQAVRLLCLERLDEGVALLERAARTHINPFYPLWNLAVAYALRGELDRAVVCYREALERAAPETEPVLVRELAVCLLHAGRSTEALALTEGFPHLTDGGQLVETALPPLRGRPVIEGESLYHEPDAP